MPVPRHREADQRPVASALERAAAEPPLAIPRVLLGNGLERIPASQRECSVFLFLDRL